MRILSFRMMCGFVVWLVIFVGTAQASNWTHTWGRPGTDYSDSIARDSAGNLYVAGATNSFGAGGNDVLLLKYDSQGNYQWSRTWGGGGDDYATSVAVGPDGRIYVVGGTSSFGAGWYDWFVLQFDTNGTLLWQRTWGGGSYDVAHDIAFDAAGNILVAGETYSFGPCCSSAAFLKLDPNGGVLSSQLWKGPATYDAAYSLATDANGDIILTGISWDYTVSPPHNSILVVKYDQNEHFLWSENWRGPGEDESWSFKAVVTDASGNIYVSGRHAEVCGSQNFATCNFDALLLKLDTNGSFQWAKTSGGIGWDASTSLGFDPAGNILTVGVDDTFGTSPQLFSSVFSPDGKTAISYLWSGGTIPSGSVPNVALATDSLGDVFISGENSNSSGSWSQSPLTSSTPSGMIVPLTTYTLGQPSTATGQPSATTGSPSGFVLDTGGGTPDVFVSIIPNSTQQPILTVSPSPVTFPDQIVKMTSVALAVMVANTGNASLNITASPSITGTNSSDFAIASTTCLNGLSILPRNSCAIELTFKPSTTTSESATLLIYDNTNDSPRSVALTGVGLAPPKLNLTPSSLTFGNVPVGSLSTLNIIVQNVGGAKLSGTASATAPFSIINAGSFDLAAAATQTITVQFAPPRVGSFSDVVSIASNGGSATVGVTGAGFNASKLSRGIVMFNGRPLAGVPVLRLSHPGLQRLEQVWTDAGGRFYFRNFSQEDYVVPVSSGALGEAGDQNPGPHGLYFLPEFCQIGDPRPARVCSGTSSVLTETFVASGKPSPLAPTITFGFPLPAGNWTLVTEAGGYSISGAPVDADPSHTDLSSGFYALDFAGCRGTPVLAAADGTVRIGNDPKSFGLNVVLGHSGGLYTRYAHLDSVAVVEGSHVTQGQMIGLIGKTGLSLGPHLHFQVYSGGSLPANSQSTDPTLRSVSLVSGPQVLALTQFVAGSMYRSSNQNLPRTGNCSR